MLNGSDLIYGSDFITKEKSRPRSDRERLSGELLGLACVLTVCVTH
jgi:hypothetical protein